MKNTVILTAAVATGAAFMLYYFKKRKSMTEPVTMKAGSKSHHRTNVFSHAKDHQAVHSNGTE